MKLRLQDEIEEKEKVHEKNLHLESELKALKKLEKSVQKIDRSKKKLEQEFQSYKVLCCHGYQLLVGHLVSRSCTSTKRMVTFNCMYLFCSFHRFWLWFQVHLFEFCVLFHCLQVLFQIIYT